MFIINMYYVIMLQKFIFGCNMYGKKLKKIRKQIAPTQEEMASILGISGRTYAAYERDENNPPYSMLVTLCKQFNVNLNWLIADIGEMFIKKVQPSVSNDELEQKVVQVMKKYGVIDKCI